VHVLLTYCRLSIGTVMQPFFYFFIFLEMPLNFHWWKSAGIFMEAMDNQREGKKTFISRITRTERRWVHQKEPVYHGIRSEGQVPTA
jgi:hypothetical protein